ncbi:hypothetical protein scyTo_0007102 [Scyliorhinus torazame]|uniref:Calponin-homology (CH) domain-containing protein n=1 Tax=Scyliorhinus torazame TaxID=75743 RepID=A0A401NLI1_SCYTO|nr:hypothetical protein [Scyliorhinus torazame]
MEVGSAPRPQHGIAAAGGGEGEDVPVLILTHFTRTPFVCFNTVRTGCSKTKALAIENPESVPVLVMIDKFPSSKGFAVSEREFLVEPAEKYYLSITWTPVDAGRVRETVTFNVGCVKVLGILLGQAEDPPKKKRSLWESIKRKKTSEGSALLKPKSSASIASKTIIISQKVEPRSPLKSCENVSPVGDRVLPLYNPSECDGQKIMQLSPILSPSQKKQELENCTPLSLKCYTTYSVLETNRISLQIEGRLDCDKKPDEPVIAETFLEPELNLVCQPVKEFSIKTPQNFPCISASHTPLNVRRILSPDSFVDDSYIPDIDCEPVVQSSVLSPDQFLKDTWQTMNQPLSSLSHLQALETASDKNVLQSGLSSKLEKSNEQLGFVAILGSPRPAQGTPAVINVDVLEPAKSRLTFLVKSKASNYHQSAGPRRQKTHQSTGQAKQLPVYTITGAKSKSVGPCELERNVKLSRQQVLEVKASFSSQSVPAAHTEAESRNPSFVNRQPFPSRKRKSSEFLSTDVHEKDIYILKRKSVHLEQSCKKSSVGKNYASCRGGKQLRKRKSVSHVKSSTTAQVKPGKCIPGVAQLQFAFRKLTKTVIPRHPMPFAAKNMFYDEHWKEKQERGFTWWLNFILTPDEFTVDTESSRVNTATLFMGSETQHHKVSVPAAPTNEEMSLRAYTAKCRLNRLRRAACRLFTSEGMVTVIQKLEVAIEAKHLVVRKDRYLWKDIGERQKILKWLLSYNPLWLRIGLECVFGELIPLESNSDVIGLARFILNRLLWNSDITAAYRHPTVPHLYRDEHKEVLAQFTLKKFLLLVWFLDCAKQSRLIDHDPCLFCKDAEFKTSKDLLLAFSRNFLSGEGDICRHLGYFGLTVGHFQTLLHEFNFAITNIAVDLRCGIRLVRAVELLTRNWKLSKQLRTPAISRLQKLHNVDVALSVLKTRGVDLKDEKGNLIDSRDIVDGHREKTLALLWRIIFAFQVEILLNEDQLQEEIEFLQNTLCTRHKLEALRSISVLSHPPKDQDLNIIPERYSSRIKLLMNWVNAVCGYYDVKVENFTVAFSDGRVLCYLIHHYHPGLLAADNICLRTMQTVECSQHGTLAIDTSTSDSDGSSIEVIPTNLSNDASSSARLCEELLENEKKNFNLVTTAVAALGGIPAMIRHIDMSNTIPEEKVVITYVSFLCARLLDLRKEARSARVIQAAWRKYKLNCELQLLQVKDHAASVIQAAARRFLHQQHFKKKINAAIIIQTLWRGHVARMKAKALMVIKMQEVQSEAATLIQTYWRGYTARRQLLRTQHYCILIQSHIRMKIAVTAYKRTVWATLVLQRHFRAHLLALAERRNYLQLKQSAVIIQSAFRRWKACKLQKQIKASIILQKYIRGFLCRLQYKRFQRSISLIQRYAKGYRIRTEISKRKKAAVTLQKHIKAYVTAKREHVSYQRLKWAAVVLQAAYRGSRSAYRGFQARRQFWILRSVVKIQSAFRAYTARKSFMQVKNATIKIQASVKMTQVRKYYRSLKKATTYVQRHYRANKLCLEKRKDYLKKREACIRLQSAVRLYFMQKQLHLWTQAAVKIQSMFRMHRLRRQYLRIHFAVVIIQRGFRAYRERVYQRQNFLRIKEAVISLQAAYKGYSVRKMIKLQHKTATKIQAVFRGHASRVKYLAMQKAVIAIQRWYRSCKVGRLERLKYLKIRTAAIILQAVVRGLVAREKLKMQHKAAVTIQTAFRRFRAQHQFEMLKDTALTVQHRFKAKLMGRKERQIYLKMRESAMTLQAAYKGMMARKEYSRKLQACIMIQSYFRMHKIRSKFQTTKQAALTIQDRFRAHVQRKHQCQKYQNIRTATIVLQAAFRAMKIRKKLKEIHKAATIIQAAAKSFMVRKHYTALRAASVLMQKRFRASVLSRKERGIYLSICRAALVIQAAYRGMKVRQEIQCKHKAATVIQAAFRMHRFCLPYQALRLAATIIQTHYRAYLQMKTDRENYMKIRNYVLHIQAAYRGMNVRKHLRSMNESAVLIQSYYRMYKQRQCYKRLCWAATAIQRRYRACTMRDTCVKQYNGVKKATIHIQSVFRGMKTRQELWKIGQAAIIIQRRFRAYRDRETYLNLKTAAATIQQRYRALLLTRIQQLKYSSVRNAAVTIQAAFRGMKVRQEIQCKNKAATVIQAAFRMHRFCLPYQALRLAATIIQTHYRAYLQMKTDRENYMKIRNNVLRIQAAYRGMIVRKHLSMNESAVSIQSYYRMYKQRQCYKRLCWAATAVQRRYRACKMRDTCVKQYNGVKKATIHIQAVFRGMKTRQELWKIGQAAVIIQRRFRAYSDRKTYLNLKTAAAIIQQRYRALLLTRIQQQKYSSVRNAAVSIQAAFRGMKVRQEIRCKHKAATVIQAAFRMHRVCVPYQALRLVATIIQTRYRAYLQMRTERENYIKIRNNILHVQAAYRGMVVRKHLRSMHESATMIQCYYRMYKQRQRYKKLCWAATAVQRRYRACKMRDTCVKQYNKLKKATVSFQAFYRGKKGRNLAKRIQAVRRIKSFLQMCITRKLFLIQKSAVIMLQTAFRGYRARIRYRAMRFAAISIQSWYRACKLGRSQLVQYQSMRHAAVTIQAAYRGMVGRHWFKQKRAAVKVQSILRMIPRRRTFLRMKCAAIVVQSHYRALKAQKLYTKYKISTVVLQRHYRSYLLMKQQRSSYLTLRRIAISLQARMRGVIAQRSYKTLFRSTLKIQACYRRKKQRKIFLLNKKAACVIQQHYRAYCQRKIEQEKYFQMKHAAVIIQNAFRRQQVRQLAKKVRAAQKIQAWFKSQFVRRQYKSILNSVIFIKQRLRGKRERSRFLKVRAATILIQQSWRMTVAKRQLQHENLRKMMAAFKIQAFWKGFKTRKQLTRKHEAACQIQLAYRSYNQRKKFLEQRMAAMVIQRSYRTWQLAKTENMKYKKIREATILLQSRCRRWLVRKKLIEQTLAQKKLRFTAAVYHHLCALKIQRMYRQYRVLKRAKEEINSVICIQRWFRTCLQRSRYLDDRRKIIVVQRTMRVWLMRRYRAAVVIQKNTRRFLYKTRKQRVHVGITKIQALWKGYCLRKKNNYHQIITIRRRIERANQNSTEEQKLCNRTAVALDYILKFKHFPHILAALQHLEVATRLSPICCENLARSGATPIILILIKSCNRSVPSMDVIKCAVQVLLNLSKYQKTSAVVYEVDNSINMLLDLLHMYRGKSGDKTSDKCGSIFTKVCCLLALLSKDSQRALEVRNLPRVADRIRNLYELTVRKHKMDIDRISAKLRMSAPRNGVSYIPATPVRTRLVSKLKPDWVLRRDNMKEIVDPLKAIQLVVDTLGIST